MGDEGKSAGLYALARLYGVQAAYYGGKRRKPASVEGLLGALQALGAPLASLKDVPQAWRERRNELYRRLMEPVAVAWDGKPPVIKLCLPAGLAEAALEGHLELESGEREMWRWAPGELPAVASTVIEGQRYVQVLLKVPRTLPLGYHRLTFVARDSTAQAMVIAAPRRVYGGEATKTWGIFLPLYALKRRQGWAGGDYTGLAALADWVSTMGGSFVATLPLLPVFLDEPLEPSPYAPVSRLFWNEFYIDLSRVAELASCPRAQEIINEPSFQESLRRLEAERLVDYPAIMKLKRRVMEELCRHLGHTAGQRLEEFHRFVRENPLGIDYARFRAVMERQKSPWHAWAVRLRDGDIREGDYDPEVMAYHLYAQWLACEQVQVLAERARRKGAGLYFDLPVGVHAAGYDVWRWRGIFALGARAGAPPDAVFTSGQDWGFPPLHPERIREQHYRYFIDVIRHHLKYAAMLRLDHIMGLHRLFFIPPGLDASQGVYVRYHADEFYAILALESHRHQSTLVGEDLGIVPAYVRHSLARHGLHRMYILGYELAADSPLAPGRIPQRSVAALNTHDMPPFAAFWQGSDIRKRVHLGLLEEGKLSEEWRARRSARAFLKRALSKAGFRGKGGTRATLSACLSFLSASPARFVVVNLEDLWLEKQFQNIPGTKAFPNWQRKARYALEEFCQCQTVRDILEKVAALRKRHRRY